MITKLLFINQTVLQYLV